MESRSPWIPLHGQRLTLGDTPGLTVSLLPLPLKSSWLASLHTSSKQEGEVLRLRPGWLAQKAAKLEEARPSQASKTKGRDPWSSDMRMLGSDGGSLWVRISQATMLCIYH